MITFDRAFSLPIMSLGNALGSVTLHQRIVRCLSVLGSEEAWHHSRAGRIAVLHGGPGFVNNVGGSARHRTIADLYTLSNSMVFITSQINEGA